MRALRKSAVIASAITFVLSACASADADVKGAAPTATEEQPAEAPLQLSNCDKVALGYIVQVPDGEFEVCAQSSSYSTSSGELSSLPDTTASFALSSYGLELTDSAVSLNHPASGASDGTVLAVADRFNNRVVLFSTLPTAASTPDVVLGQPDFTDTTPGEGLADLNWPGAVEMTPDGALIVADTENGRLLIWNDTPSANGTPADFALDLASLTGNKDAWPWGIWSDGNSLVVTDTRQGNILVWDTFPTDSASAPTSISNPNGVGTPRNITSDGSSFLIGDENGQQQQCWGQEPQNRSRQSHVWVNRLPVGEPDGCVWDWYQGDAIDGGVIALAAGGQDVHYWPQFPIDDATADARMTTGSQSGPQPSGGQPMNPPEGGDGQPQPGDPNGPQQPQEGPSNSGGSGQPSHSYLGGDGGDVVVTDTAIYFIEYNGNRVTAWNSLPADILGKYPDFSVFDQDPEVSTLLRDGFIQNPVLVNADGALVASSDYDRRMYVWNEAPTSDAAQADYIYLTGFPAWDNAYAAGTLVIAGRDSVAVWNDFTPGALPDQLIQRQVGTLSINDVKGVAYDGTYFAISEPQTDTVAVFEGIPSAGDEPIHTYSVRGPGRLDMRDGILLIAPKEGSEIFVVDVTSGQSPQKLPVRVNLPNQAKFLPFGVGIADTSFHRVQLWGSLADMQSGAAPQAVIGGEAGARPQTTASGLYFPASLEAVGEYLYVGEFKFSNRILAYKGP